MMKSYSITFLGTGTSSGMPVIGCDCPVCTSADKRDTRLRASALVRTSVGNTFLIDVGPDFRYQILKQGAPALTAALLTHSHYDHVGGIDDLRPYCSNHKDFTLYCQANVARDLRARVPYCFGRNLYPGVPTFDIHTIDCDKPFEAAGDVIVPLPVMHHNLPIVGYRLGPLAYITDCKTMPDSTVRLLEGVDTLVLNALRLQPHHSHLNLAEALQIIERVCPRRALLTHLCHQMGRHADVCAQLPPGVSVAYDGQVVEVPCS